jgi:hypothetical protein
MANLLNREQEMYTALAQSAQRALESTFEQLDEGESLVEMTQAAKTERNSEKSYGWDCSIVAPNELKAFSLGIVQGLDGLAEYWEVNAHPAYIAAKNEAVEHIMNIGNCEAATVKQIQESLNFLRSIMMKLKIQINEDNNGMLTDIAQDFVQAYEVAQSDPEIAAEYADLRHAVLNGSTTNSALKIVLERFVAKLPEFQRSSRAFMNEMVSRMNDQAEHFGIAEAPQLITFFEEVALQLSVATKPSEFMAIGQLLEQLEPLMTEKIVNAGNIEKVRDFVMNVVNEVQGAYNDGVAFSPNANSVLNQCHSSLADENLSREGYLDVLRDLREVRVAG